MQREWSDRRYHDTMVKYTVVLDYDPEEDVFNVSVIELPGCLTWGKTRAQALRRAEEAIVVYLEMSDDPAKPVA